MRIVAGSARGIVLVGPRDRATRPITDRVKETLFGILAGRVMDARVLDLYAGTGSIGIEALSRGAASATFVERGHAAIDALQANLAKTGLAATAQVVRGDVARFLATPNVHEFDLVFLDPPYEERAILAPLERLMPHLASGAVVVVKHHWRTEMPAVERLPAVRERRFGETVLTFFEHRTDGVEGS